MKIQKYRAKAINRGDTYVEGYYFKSPLTDENSGLPPESGWFFLTGTEQKHCIATEEGVVYVVEEKTIKPIEYEIEGNTDIG